MADRNAPADAPPSYAMATGSSTTSSKPQDSSRLQVPASASASIPAAHRRSMEDEHRPLPSGWLRQWDTTNEHQFYVNTNVDPPKSIWHHPYDDEQYLSTLSSEERERIQAEELERRYNDHTDDESSTSKQNTPVRPQATGSSSFDGPLPPRPEHQKKSFGDKLKEKVTGQTKEERDQHRRQREEEERQYYEAHQKFRECMTRAQMTGQPQFFAKDREGKSIYVEPPQNYGGGYGGGYPGARAYGNGYGYNPYTSGPYSDPNVRFVRPGNPYNRPYGGGYGGGLGMPVAGGLLGGMLLGGLLF